MLPRPLRPSLLILPLILAGCTAVGPDHVVPAVPMADGWLEPASAEPVDPRWWQAFGDPVLTGLIERALAGSPDLKQAAARVAEARAGREAAQGGRLPQGGAAASATQNRLSENGQLPIGALPGFDPSFPLYDIGFDASWELDLWGGTARGIESAAAQEQAAQWARRDAMVSLAAEIARAYVDYRAAQTQLTLADERVDAAGELARLTQLLRQAGEAGQIDADRTAAAAQAARAARLQDAANVAGLEYRIAALVGVVPENLVPELRASAAPIPQAPAVVGSGIRSDLLRRRPDIRLAERQLAAASADIGVATAQLYPSISLIGQVGMQAREPGDLTDGASLRYSVGPSFRWPLFSMGRLRAQVRAADARAQGAAARYEAAVIGALSESEAAANRYATAAEVGQATAGALQRESNAFELARLRQGRGEDSRLTLAQARLRLIDARGQDAAALAARGVAAVALYKALGGGWEDQSDVESSADSEIVEN